METQFSEQDSLAVISKMIETAKNQVEKYTGVYLLLWGYLVFTSSMLHFILLKFTPYAKYSDYSYLLILTGCFFIIPIHRKQAAEEKVKTFVGQVVGYFWISFAVTSVLLGAFVFIQPSIGSYIFPLMLILLATVLFASGTAYKYRPLIAGSIVCWVASLLTFFVNFEYQILIYAASILTGYIIPGHMIIHKAHV